MSNVNIVLYCSFGWKICYIKMKKMGEGGEEMFCWKYSVNSCIVWCFFLGNFDEGYPEIGGDYDQEG